MPGVSYSGPKIKLSEEERTLLSNLKKHVNIVSQDIGERNIWEYPALEATVDYISGLFKSIHNQVKSQEFLVDGKLVKNIEMELQGDTDQGEIIVVGAHYDSLRGTPGANDNGSGIAALLELARLVAQKPIQKTIRFVAFVNEEPPFFMTESMGSWIYAKRARQRNENIVAMFSLETIGAYYQDKGSQRYPFPFGNSYPDTGDFIAFVSNLSSKRLIQKCIKTFRKNATLPSEGIAAPQWMTGIAWSDQWAFWKENYPAVMITDTAPFRYKYYHTARDTAEKLNYDSFTRAVDGLSYVLEDLAGLLE